MLEDVKGKRPRRLAIWVGGAALVVLIVAAVLWGPWILDDPYLRDKNGNLSSSAGTVITGFRTSLVALAAAAIAGTGVWFTHRTLEHTREKDRRQQKDQDVDRYGQLVHDHDIDLLLKAVENDDVADAIDTYDGSFSSEERRRIIVADVQYRNAFFAYSIGVMPWDEFYGRVRTMLQNHWFREYWHASRHQRASLPETSLESQVGRRVDDLDRMLDEADVDEWWVVGEAPETG
ncbi:DUF6082 family protein [Streptomyces ureilyticus]|uniref:DUF4760 domain-containing protein n=1 Tax=Streptomyces ureilyticus TaxID=1775131 RepID=A0ABX0DYI8_9ACTN|nr:DUF6082 family protein [Streptomyces ureilyticus]NGO46305.1 hypothetical protein [Streptomyces ureilyticus]